MRQVFTIAALLAMMVAANLATSWVRGRRNVALAVVFSVTVALLGLAFGLDIEALGVAPGTILPGLAWAGVAIAAVAVALFLGSLIRPLRVLFADDATSRSGRHVARRALVDVPFGTVLLEETVFRGVLYGVLVTHYGDWTAVWGTSVLFGLWHVVPSLPPKDRHPHASRPAPPTLRRRVWIVVGTVAFTTAAGFVFAGLRWWTGSILPGIGLHWATNGLGLAAAWLLARWTRRRVTAAPAGPAGRND